MSQKYTDIIVTVKDGIGTIKVRRSHSRLSGEAQLTTTHLQFNRPKQLNSFGGNLIVDTIDALRELDAHPDTTFTVITGEGRFFASGADVNSQSLYISCKFTTRVLLHITELLTSDLDISNLNHNFRHTGEKKVFWAQNFAVGMELVRALIDHRKVLVLAMNGPGVGAGAAWFQGASDLFFAAEGTWLQVVFSQLGLVPENGSARNWADSMGTHRANEFLMLGGKTDVAELQKVGMVNKIFPKEGFHEAVQEYLRALLAERDGTAMMEMKRLANGPLREKRIVALFDSMNALAERFVDGEPMRRMSAKKAELEGEFFGFLFLYDSLDLYIDTDLYFTAKRKSRQSKI